MPRPHKPIPAGTIYGHWFVHGLDRVVRKSYHRIFYYNCECLLCRSMYRVDADSLRSRHSKSCRSCAARARFREIPKPSIDRGLRYAQLWFCYRMYRCGLDLDRLIWGNRPAISKGYESC